MTLRLWILEPAKGLPKDKDPWDPWYDKAFGFVVSAATEEQARTLAQKNGGDERDGERSPWLNPAESTCKLLTPGSEPGVVMKDFASA